MSMRSDWNPDGLIKENEFQEIDVDGDCDMRMKLERRFYERDDVVAIGRELLGKVLCTRIRGTLTSAIITETEAYAGAGDRASHAYRGRRTRRTEPMFAAGGTAYVYLCYGLHHLFNVVTGEIDTPHAVLVRAGHALDGEALIRRRRGPRATVRALLAGPGSLAEALGIRTRHSGISLLGDRIWIEDRGLSIDGGTIVTGPRVGVGYAGPDARRPYRFRLREMPPPLARGPN